MQREELDFASSEKAPFASHDLADPKAFEKMLSAATATNSAAATEKYNFDFSEGAPLKEGPQGDRSFKWERLGSHDLVGYRGIEAKEVKPRMTLKCLGKGDRTSLFEQAVGGRFSMFSDSNTNSTAVSSAFSKSNVSSQYLMGGKSSIFDSSLKNSLGSNLLVSLPKIDLNRRSSNESLNDRADDEQRFHHSESPINKLVEAEITQIAVPPKAVLVTVPACTNESQDSLRSD